MRTFEQKQHCSPKRVSSSIARPNRATPGPTHREHPILHLQRTIGNQSVQRILQRDAEELEAGLTAKTSHRFGHDFSGIPLHPPAAGTIQTKLAINKPGDEYEQEADRISEQMMRMPEPQPQRACACGGGCPKCQKRQPERKSERLRARGIGSSQSRRPAAPPIVNTVLASPGHPLELATRAFFESRFGEDFSRVRVHSDASAQQSARAMNARAYTVGHNIVFGAGQYAPGTHQGQRLIAHELAHVVQQRVGSTLIQRKVDVKDFEVEEFDQLTIRDYLMKIRGGEIEDDNDSDDKARFIVREWFRGKSIALASDELDAKTKATLIREMQSGFTGNDDERAILVLLLNSSDADLQVIFAPGSGIDPKDLDSDFHGGEEEELRAFYDRKFVGGRQAALRGSRKLLLSQEPKLVDKRPWRELARAGVPFDQWPRQQQQEAERENRAVRRRTWTDPYPGEPQPEAKVRIRGGQTQPAPTNKAWWEMRDQDKETSRLLHPYRDELKALFERTTYTRIESSQNPSKSGESVTFTAYVSLPDPQQVPTGEVTFTFFNREMRRIHGPSYTRKSVAKATLKDGKASITLPLIHKHEVEAIYPDTGGLIGSSSSLIQEVTP